MHTHRDVYDILFFNSAINNYSSRYSSVFCKKMIECISVQAYIYTVYRIFVLTV